MGQINANGLATWVIKRILAYFNRAIDVKDITSGMLKDDPGTGTGNYAIGEVVAQRILDHRNSLPGRKFSEIEELNEVLGLGADKFHDLVYSFSVPAAEQFKADMYASVIGENWLLEAFSVHFEDAQEMSELVRDARDFEKWLEAHISAIAIDKYGLKNANQEVKGRLRAACPQVFESGHIASYALALWFYRFDADNWFAFEGVRAVAESYLDFMPDPADRSDLYLFRGFRNAGVLAQPVTVTDLPVVVNYAEQKITIWSAQLND